MGLFSRKQKKNDSSSSPSRNDIAIIGMACHFPDANHYHEYWENLIQGKNSIREIPKDRWDIDQYYSPDINVPNKSISKWGGLLEDISSFDAEFFNISPREAQSMDPQQRLLLQEAWHCLEDAGMPLTQLQTHRTSVFVGVMAIDYQQELAKSDEVDSYACIGNYEGILANRISYCFGLNGESKAIDTACSSSLVAIHDARRNLLNGESDYAIAAGVSIICHPWKYISFSKSRMLSPDGQCKTFDQQANGYVPGEGVGVLLLTTLENALAYGHRIHGIIKGSAVNHSGKSSTITAPRVQSQKEVILQAQKVSGINAAEISYIEAHGTGTSLGDPIEIESLTQAFQETTHKKQFCAIGSVKTNIGHLEAAAGIAGVIKVILMMQHHKLVPTLNIKTVNSLISFEQSAFYLSQQVTEWQASDDQKRCAGISSFGFGGVNTHVILEEYIASVTEILAWDSSFKEYPFLLSAKSPESLEALIKGWQNYSRRQDFQYQDSKDISYTLMQGREMFYYRFGMMVKDSNDLAEKLQTLALKKIDFAKEYNKKIALWLSEPSDMTLEEFNTLRQQQKSINKYYDQCCEMLINLKQKSILKKWQKGNIDSENQTLWNAVVCYCLTSYIIGLGFKPNWISGSGTGRIIAAAVSGYLSLKDMFQIFLDQKEKIKKSFFAITFYPPAVSFYDAYTNKLILRLNIENKACEALRLRFIQDASLLPLLKAKIQRLEENQFTFKQYLTDWDKELKEHADLTLEKLWELTERQDTQYKQLNSHAFLLEVILLSSLKKLQQKWQITDHHSQISNELGSLIKLIISDKLSYKDVIAWILQENNETFKKSLNDLQFSNVESLDNLLVLFPKSAQENLSTISSEEWLSPVISHYHPNPEEEIIVLGYENPFISTSTMLHFKEVKAFSEWILSLWEKGLIHKDIQEVFLMKGQITSLPLYPFLKKRYWYDGHHQNKLSTPLTITSPQTVSTGNTLKLKNLSDSLPKEKTVTLIETISPCLIASEQVTVKNKIDVYQNNKFSSAKMMEKLSHLLSQLLYFEDTGTLNPDKPFIEYGLDSILAVELIRQINAYFDLTINAAKLYDFPTLTTLSHYISKLVKERYDSTSVKMFEETDPIVLSSLTVLEQIADNKKPSFMLKDLSIKSEKQAVHEDAIVIIGMSARLPGAENIREYWNNLRDGTCNITEIPSARWSVDTYYSSDSEAPGKSYSKWGGFIENVDQFDPLFFNISPAEAEWMDPQQRLFLEESWKALEDAGYSQRELSGTRCGVFVGVMNNDYAELIQRADGMKTSQLMTGNSNSILASRIAYMLNLKGPVVTVDTACSSSLVAVHLARQALLNREADLMLAGGVTLYLTETPYIQMSKAGMLSKDGFCKAFDQRADGFVPGEGCGVVVLKRLQDALNDGDTIYGIIRGSGVNQDGKTNGITAPSGESQRELALSVYQNCGINPQTISYIEAHGTGTKLGDPIEIGALIDSFRTLTDKKHYCAIGSVKSNIGHTSAAAGVASLIKVLLCMHHKQLVPTLHYQEPNEHINFAESPFYVNTELKEWKTFNNQARLAAINSFGFSGTNAHVVIEAPEQTISHQQSKPYYLVTLSAKQKESLKQKIADLSDYLQDDANRNIEAISYTLNVGRSHFKHRVALVVSNSKELREHLEQQKYVEGDAGKKPEDAAIYAKVLETIVEELKLSKVEDPSQYKSNLEALANLYAKGYDFDWDLLHQGEACQKISLPTYPFSKQRYWVEYNRTENSPVVLKNSDKSKRELNLEYYVPRLVYKEIIESLNNLSDIKTLCLFSSNKLLFTSLQNQLPIVSIIQSIDENNIPRDCYHFIWIKQRAENDEYLENLEEVRFVQKVVKAKIKGPRYFIVVYPKSESVPMETILSGFAKSLLREQPNYYLKTVEVDNTDPEEIAKYIKAELMTKEFKVIYSQGKRLVERYIPVEEKGNTVLPWKPKGVYLITGGLGKLGLIFSHYLAKNYQAKLILTGRSTLDEKKENTIRGLEQLGAEVLYLSGDVADLKIVESWILETKRKFGILDGIIHSAGIIEDELLLTKSMKGFQKVLYPKVKGVINLDKASEDECLDVFILFSSIASCIGNVGQSDYAAANIYLDEFAKWRSKNRKNGKTLSVNWPLWKKGGMTVTCEVKEYMAAVLGLEEMPSAEGLAALDQCLTLASPQVVVCYGIKNCLTKFFAKQELLQEIPIKPLFMSDKSFRKEILSTKVNEACKEIIKKILKLSKHKIDDETIFSEYGFDSITFTQFSTEIYNTYKIELTPAIFYTYPNLRELENYLIENYSDNLREIYGEHQSGLDTINRMSQEELEQNEIEIAQISEKFQKESIAIIGISGIFPQSSNLEEFWLHLAQDDDLITEVPLERWDWRKYYDTENLDPQKTNSKWGGFIPDVDKFDPQFFDISPREAELMDPQHRLLLQTVWQAIESSGYNPESLRGKNIALFVGVQFNEYQHLLMQAGISDAFGATGNSHAMLVNRISYLMDWHGASEAIDTACSSSLVAVHRAVQSLQAQESEMAVASGVSLALIPETFIATSKLGMLSSEGRCKTFDENADGYVKGEGVGAIVLKPLSKAIKDKDVVLGVIKGSSVKHGGKAQTLTAPNAKVQSELIIEVFKKGGISPETVSYIETHGTGTKLGDPAEIEGLKLAFNKMFQDKNISLEKRPVNYCGLGSVKTNAGHLEPAAGIIGIIKILLAMKHKTLPGNVHLQKINSNIQIESTPFYIIDKAKFWECLKNEKGEDLPRCAGINSFGFGGAYAHVVIEEGPRRILSNQQTKPYYLITLSAKHRESLTQKIEDLICYLNKNKNSNIEAISYTLNTGRSHFNHRIALVVSNSEELKESLEKKEYFQENTSKKPDDAVIYKQVLETVFESLKNNHYQDEMKYKEKLEALANFYIKGYNLDWYLLHQSESHQKISLPGYPFLKQTYWYNSYKKSKNNSYLTSFENNPENNLPVDLSNSKLRESSMINDKYTQSSNIVKWEINESGIAIVKMEDKIHKNQFSKSLLASLENSFKSIQEDTRAKVIVLTGYDNIFCLGGNKELLLAVSQSQIKYTETPFIYRGLLDCPLPVIAAIQGHAFGAGLAFGLYADMVLLSESHLYTANFMRYGFTPGVGSTLILEKKLTAPLALEMMWTAQEYTGAELKTRGALVTAHPAHEVLPKALQLAEELAKKSKDALQVFKKQMAKPLLDQLPEAIERELAMHVEIFAKPEAKENIQAYFNKLENQYENKIESVIDHFSSETTKLPLKALDVYENKNNFFTVEYVINQLKEIVSERLHLPQQQINIDAEFNELGVDSIAVVEIVRHINRIFGLSLEATSLYDYPTIQKLSIYLNEQIVKKENIESSLIAKEQLSSQLSQQIEENKTQQTDSSQKLILSTLNTTSNPTSSSELVNINSSTLNETTARKIHLDIAVIGMAGQFPGAKNLDEFWQNLIAGRSSIIEIPSERWHYSAYFDSNLNQAGKTCSKWGGYLQEVDKFDPLFFNISPREAELMDPQQRLFLQTAWQALEDAGFTAEKLVSKKCGVYVGVCPSDYADLLGQKTEAWTAHYLLGMNSSILAARIAYLLNLTGPAMAIDTACSSSLVALHQACQSVAQGDSEIALAGGVCTLITPKIHILTSQAGMLSPEGYCKTFDNTADGFVPAEGVGVIVLKSLEKALQDKDHIYGVIKGSGINQDGATNGITAPSARSQEELLDEVYSKYNINPKNISYVEAHGTGTKLGDPIEVKALKQSFGKFTQEKKYCAIGSVKTNIGHTLTAAGIASVIKILLCMQHKKLVPTIHYQEPNEHIDFENSPFYVNTELKEWKTLNSQRRLAAISSFGFSGTNAHMVIEEAPEQILSKQPIKPYYLITLSAKHEDSLKLKVDDLIDYLKGTKNLDQSIESISYTLNAGRSHFNHRIALVVSNSEELKKSLEKEKYFQGNTNKKPDDAAIYKQVLETTLEHLKNSHYHDEMKYKEKLEALANLYIKGYDLDWNLLHQGEGHQKISLPTYPFLKKHYWIPAEQNGSLILNKNGLVTHSLHPMIDLNESTFTEQLFKKRLNAKIFYLRDHVVRGRILLPGTGHLEIGRAAGALASRSEVTGIQNVLWLRPVILEKESLEITISLKPYSAEESFYSHFEIYSEQDNQRSVYSEGELNFNPVSFEETQLDIEAIRSRCDQCIEHSQIYRRLKEFGFDYRDSFQTSQRFWVGDGEVLQELDVPQSIKHSAKEFILHPALMDGALRTLMGMYLASADYAPLSIPFSMDQLKIRKAVNGKCYAYARFSEVLGEITKSPKGNVLICDEIGEVCVEIKGFAAREFKGTGEEASKKSNDSLLLYQPSWRQSSLDLFFSDSFRSENVIWIDNDKISPWLEIETQLLQRCSQKDNTSIHIIYKCLSAEDTFHEVVLKLQSLFKSMDKAGIKHCHFVFGYILSRFEGISGLFHAMKILKPNWILKTVKLEGEAPDSNQKLLNEIMVEEKITCQEISYHCNQRLIRTFESIPEINLENTKCLFRKQGVYLLTGGLGGIGKQVARMLAREYQAKLILLGRKALTKALKQEITELETYGSEVLYVSGDVSHQSTVENGIQQGKEKYGSLNGIFHAAGVLSSISFLMATPEEIKNVLATKVNGTIYLDEATKQEALDFFVVFSSISSIAGDFGIGTYSLANRFMDSYIEYREGLKQQYKRQGKSLSINWPYWEDGGMRLPEEERPVYVEHMGLVPLDTETGLKVLDMLLTLPYPQVLVARGNIGKIEVLLGLKKFNNQQKEIAPEKILEKTFSDNSSELLIATHNYLKEIFCEVTKVMKDEIEIEKSLESYGIDSIMIINLNQRLSKDLSHLRKTLLFEYRTLKELANYLVKVHVEDLQKLFKLESAETASINRVTSRSTSQKHFQQKIHSRFREQAIRSEENQKHISIPVSKDKKGILYESPSSCKDIAIIGLAGHYPKSKSLEEFWQHLKEGMDFIEEVPKERWDYRSYYEPTSRTLGKMHSKWGSFIQGVDKFDALFFNISPREAEQIDPQERLMLEIAWKAIEDAGYDPLELHKISQGKVGVFVGSMWNEYHLLLAESQQKLLFGNSNMASLANRISYVLNVNGPSLVIDTACSSSLAAIHMAVESIAQEECQYAIAGGVNLSLHPSKYVNMSQMGLLSTDGRCRSFGKDGNGYVPGEGVGAVFLKSLFQALEDGDHIYGVIKGTSLNHGGKTNGFTVPNPEAQAELIKAAFIKSNIPPESISYIETHGTGTALGDPIEITGLEKAFGEVEKQSCAIGSIKSNIGHLEGAAGIVALTKVLLQLKYKQLVPSIHSQTLNPYIEFDKTPFYVQRELGEWKSKLNYKRCAGISSFGATGTNVHVVIEEGPEKIISSQQTKPYYLVTLSAKHEESLKQKINDLIDYLKERKNLDQSIEAISYTLNTGRSHFNYRIALVVSNREELKESLEKQNYFQEDASKKPDDTAIYKQVLESTLEVLKNNYYQNEIKYKEKLEALANLYVKGYDLNWQLLHQEESHQKISLPTYPFSQQRYWVSATSGVKLNSAYHGVEKLHPLIDKNISTLESLAFKVLLRKEQFYLRDHQVKGQAILPGVAYLEMARAAGNLANPGQTVTVFNYVVWPQPIVVSEDIETVINLYPEHTTNKLSFEVSTGKNEARIIHSHGEIIFGDRASTSKDLPNINNLQKSLTQMITKENLYQKFNQMGLEYGKTFQSLEWVRTAGREALGYFKLPEDLIVDKDQFGLHPALDGVLQTAAVLRFDQENLALTYGMDSLTCYQQLPESGYVYVKSRERSREGLVKLDFQVINKAHEICIEIEGIAIREFVANQENTKAKAKLSYSQSQSISEFTEILSSEINTDELYAKTLSYFKEIVSSVLKLPIAQLKETTRFEQYGIDSILVMNLTRELEKDFGVLPKTLFFEYQTLFELTDYFLKQYRKILQSKFLADEQTISKVKSSYLLQSKQDISSKRLISRPQYSVYSETKSMYGENDIAIIGLSGRYPEANNIEQFWKNLQDGKDSVIEIPKDRWDYELFYDSDKSKWGKSYGKWGGFIENYDKFDSLFFNISPREAELIDPQERLFLEVAWETLEDAGYTTEYLESLSQSNPSIPNAGVFVGVMYGLYQLYSAEESLKGNGLALSSSYASIANRVSYYLNLSGPSMAVDTMCSSSLSAIHLACKSIREGECQIALAGGVNITVHPNKYLWLSQGKFLASDGKCKSFGEGGDGYVPGEGVGVVLLKPLTKALVDGDRIYGVIKGSSVNHGGRTNGYAVPNPNAQAELIENAFRKANIEPKSVSYIEAQGTGTSLGDPIEIRGLVKAFGETEKQSCPIGSVKSNIGHLESAAGIAALTKVLLQLKHKQLVPSIHSETLNSHIDFANTPFYVQRELKEWKSIPGYPRRAGISSFGAGGSNAHLIIEEAPEQVIPHQQTKPHYLIALSAKHEESLKHKIHDLIIYLIENRNANIESIAYTLNTGRSHFDHRIALIVSHSEELRGNLEKQKYFQGDANKKPDDAAIYQQVLKTSLEALRSNPLKNTNDYRKKLETLANLYVKGYDPDWNLLHQGESHQKISLPKYPFLKKRYWYDGHHQNKLSTSLMITSPQMASTGNTLKLKNLSGSLSEGKTVAVTDLISPLNVFSEQAMGKNKADIHQNNQFSPTKIVEKLSHLLSQLLYLEDTGSLNLEKPFAEYGLDSVLAVELIKQINTYFNLTINAAKLYDFPTLTTLSHYISNLVNEKYDSTSGVSLTESDSMVSSSIVSEPIHSEHNAADKKTPFILNNLSSKGEKQAVHEDTIVIIGMSAKLPGADNIREYWNNLRDGTCSITEIPSARWSVDTYYSSDSEAPGKSYSKWGGFIENVDQFDPLFFNISPAEAEWMDPQQRLFLEESWKALEDAGYSQRELGGTRCGVFVGVINNDYIELIQRADGMKTSQFMTGNSNSILASRIAYMLNLKGPVITVDTACSSSLVAVHLARHTLLNREADLMLAGGVTLYLTETPYIQMSKARMLSKDGLCKAFDRSADGFVPGEGCGVVVLKRLQDALRDGDRIYGIIRGSGVNQDGKTNGITAPSSESQKTLALSVYQNCGINPETISYVEAQGIGSKLGDHIEVEALIDSFRTLTDKKHYCAIGSVKSNIGHTSAAAGVASLIKVLLCMHHKQLVPTLHYQEPNEHINFAESPFYMNTELKEWKTFNNQARLAAINSFGFSGTNAHVVIEAPEQTISHQQSKPYYLVTLSAKQKESLKQKIADLINYLQADANRNIEAISYTLNVGRSHFKHRVALVVSNSKELREHLEQQKYVEGDVGKKPEDAAIYAKVLETIVEELKLSKVEDPSQYKSNLEALANLYAKGYDFDWDLLHQGESCQKISLPTYPFLRQRYWVSVTSAINYQHQLIEKLQPLIDKNISTLESQAYDEIKNESKKNVIFTDKAATSNDNQSRKLKENCIEELKEMIGSVLKVPLEALEEDEELTAYGFDSISLTGLASKLKQCYQLSALSPTLLFEYSTISKFADYLCVNHGEALLVKYQSDTRCRESRKSSSQSMMLSSKVIRQNSYSRLNEVLFKKKLILENYSKTFLNYQQLNISLFLTLRNIEMEIVQAGKGEVILFLPPAGSSFNIWRYQLDELSKNYRTISLNYPGCGRSNFYPFSYADLADLIIEIIDELGIDVPFNLAGWSMGGILAQVISNKYSNYVKKLVLVNSVTNLTENIFQSPDKLKLLEEDFNENLKISKINNISLGQFNGITSNEARSHYYNNDQFFNWKNSSFSEAFMNISKLIIVGGRDKIVPSQISQKIWDSWRNTKLLTLESAGHYIPLFNSTYFNEKLLDFFNSFKPIAK